MWQCATCQINARKCTNARLSLWGDVDEFFKCVHMDVAYFQNTKLLVLMDTLSRWVDVHILKDLLSAVTIQALRRVFKYIGLPRTLVSDNGTNFASDEFKCFLQSNYIKHVHTPPGHHQSNGLAECKIHELKFWLDKHANKGELNVQLIAFCLHFNTTTAANNAVPADLIFDKTLLNSKHFSS